MTAVAVAAAASLAIAFSLGGAFVWFYNRVLSKMQESTLKKVFALCVLPLGCVLGLAGGCLLAWGGSAPLRFASGGLAVAGGVVAARQVAARMVRRRAESASRFQAVAVPGPVVDASTLSPVRRGILRVLAPVNGVGRLRIHHRVVESPRVPVAFDGYRIVHLTDIHLHKTLHQSWYDAVASTTAELQPDVVLFGGDFVSKPRHLPRVTGWASRLRAPDGVFAVRGNHDFWKSPRFIARCCRRAGLCLLANDEAIVERAGQAISIVGLETPYAPLDDGDHRRLAARPGMFRLALVHTPDAFPDAAMLGADVMLAGHTHGGQVQLPLIGATLTGCGVGPFHATGVSRWGRALAIVSNGQGAFFPLRVGAPPEIVLLELKTGGAASGPAR